MITIEPDGPALGGRPAALRHGPAIRDRLTQQALPGGGRGRRVGRWRECPADGAHESPWGWRPRFPVVGIPCIDRGGIAHEVGDVWNPQLVGRPTVELGETWHDHAQVEEPTQGVLIGDVVVELPVSGYRCGRTRDTERNMPVMSSRGSPSNRPMGASPASARCGAATRAWAYSTRTNMRLMKKRSTRFSRSARSRWSRYALTIVTLCARYHVRGRADGRIGRTARHWATTPDPGGQGGASAPRRCRAIVVRSPPSTTDCPDAHRRAG